MCRSLGRSPGSKRFLGLENPLKMHILSINFISFYTAEIYNALHMQGKKGDFGILGIMAPLPLLNPLVSRYKFSLYFGYLVHIRHVSHCL